MPMIFLLCSIHSKLCYNRMLYEFVVFKWEYFHMATSNRIRFNSIQWIWIPRITIEIDILVKEPVYFIIIYAKYTHTHQTKFLLKANRLKWECSVNLGHTGPNGFVDIYQKASQSQGVFRSSKQLKMNYNGINHCHRMGVVTSSYPNYWQFTDKTGSTKSNFQMW